MKKKLVLTVLILLCAVPCFALKDRWEVGSVDTAFKLFGPNHKVVVEGFRDPDFPSIVCYVSHARAGGISGAVGLAEDPARFSLSLVRSDSTPIRPTAGQKKEKQVFKSRSAVFRKMNVVRFYDEETNCFVYLATSTLLLDGSPFNAVAAVPLN
ncbi:MAG: CreA family protein [Pyramidobacter sp.]|jgi:CreA protein